MEKELVAIVVETNRLVLWGFALFAKRDLMTGRTVTMEMTERY